MTATETAIRRLAALRRTLATAESCTGGLLAAAITDVPGASAVFHAGFVTYSNDAKTALLGVSPDTLAAHGAVSPETVLEMADGAARRAAADYALALSGIAGPTGGTPEKPVGLVFIALRTPDALTAHRYLFPGPRPAVRSAAVSAALDLLLAALPPA
ncbi:MAG: CinA family protein [Kiritimatiellae bacterium]|nr:CinA family protein [Kiritimatiellia bacterium]